MAEAPARSRLRKICLALPEVTIEEEHPPHLGFVVAKKRFCWYLDNHHGDGRISIDVRAAPEENRSLVASDGDRFALPKYMARYGWVIYYIDLPGRPPDWDEVAELVTDSYRIQAPKRLTRLIE